MKLWKKLLASVGVAGALAAAPAQAAPYLFLQLFTADAAGNNVAQVGGFNLQTAGLTDAIVINGTFNGWNLTTNVFGLTGSLFSVNPLSMQISGTAYRAADATGTVKMGSTGGLGTPGCAGVVGGDPTLGCGLGSFGQTSVSLSNTTFNIGTYNAGTNTAGTNAILKVRLGLANWPVPASGTTLNDTLSFSAPTSGAAAPGDKATQQIDLSQLGGGIQSLGTVNFPVGAGNTGTTTLINIAANNFGSGNLVFGFDLLSNGIQNPATSAGQQFGFTNSIIEIPEPGTLALLGLALVGVAAVRRKSAVAA